MNFKESIKLDLWNCGISSIEVLEKIKFDKLEILWLSSNHIPDISVLEKVNFKNLKSLGLAMNKI